MLRVPSPELIGSAPLDELRVSGVIPELYSGCVGIKTMLRPKTCTPI